MSEVWQTIEQAAVTLGLSVRTVNRHITAGKLQSRLFEGRREVLIPPTEDPPRIDRSPSSFASTSAREGQPARAELSPIAEGDGSYVPNTNGQSVANGEPVGSFIDPSARESFRQTVKAQVASDKSFDAQTMLALTDSIDDKATLAVAAYQTLARSAEIQVQSLRRVAFGAWAVVGLMAVGLIVAVGWATHRLTTAEVTATHLNKEVAKQTTEMERLVAERDKHVAELEAVRQQANVLHARMEAESKRADEQRSSAAEMVQFAVRLTEQARAATAPFSPPTTTPVTSPAVAPAGPSGTGQQIGGSSSPVGGTTGSGFGTPTSRPIAPPATRPSAQGVPLPPNTGTVFGRPY